MLTWLSEVYFTGWSVDSCVDLLPIKIEITQHIVPCVNSMTRLQVFKVHKIHHKSKEWSTYAVLNATYTAVQYDPKQKVQIKFDKNDSEPLSSSLPWPRLAWRESEGYPLPAIRSALACYVQMRGGRRTSGNVLLWTHRRSSQRKIYGGGHQIGKLGKANINNLIFSRLWATAFHSSKNNRENFMYHSCAPVSKMVLHSLSHGAFGLALVALKNTWMYWQHQKIY